jgi:hypothetical protein
MSMRNVASTREDRPQRPDEIFATIEQFPRADGIAPAMRMAIENRWKPPLDAQRTSEEATHLVLANAKAQFFDQIAVVLSAFARQQRNRRLLETEQFAETGTCNRHLVLPDQK